MWRCFAVHISRRILVFLVDHLFVYLFGICMGYIVGLGLYFLDSKMLFPPANLFSLVLLFTNHARWFECLGQDLASSLRLFAADAVWRRHQMVLQFPCAAGYRIQCHAQTCPVLSAMKEKVLLLQSNSCSARPCFFASQFELCLHLNLYTDV